MAGCLASHWRAMMVPVCAHGVTSSVVSDRNSLEMQRLIISAFLRANAVLRDIVNVVDCMLNFGHNVTFHAQNTCSQSSTNLNKMCMKRSDGIWHMHVCVVEVLASTVRATLPVKSHLASANQSPCQKTVSHFGISRQLFTTYD